MRAQRNACCSQNDFKYDMCSAVRCQSPNSQKPKTNSNSNRIRGLTPSTCPRDRPRRARGGGGAEAPRGPVRAPLVKSNPCLPKTPAINARAVSILRTHALYVPKEPSRRVLEHCSLQKKGMQRMRTPKIAEVKTSNRFARWCSFERCLPVLTSSSSRLLDDSSIRHAFRR